MENIYKLHTDLLGSYASNTITEPELIGALESIKEMEVVNADISRLNQEISDMHKDLLDKYKTLKTMVGEYIKTVYGDTPDPRVISDIIDHSAGNVMSDAIHAVYEDRDITSVSDPESVRDIIKSHTDIMYRYVGGYITHEVYIKEMSSACKLDRQIFDGIRDVIESTIQELTSYDTTTPIGEIKKYTDMSSTIVHALCLQEYAPHTKGILDGTYDKYIEILKQVIASISK